MVTVNLAIWTSLRNLDRQQTPWDVCSHLCLLQPRLLSYSLLLSFDLLSVSYVWSNQYCRFGCLLGYYKYTFSHITGRWRWRWNAQTEEVHHILVTIHNHNPRRSSLAPASPQTFQYSTSTPHPCHPRLLFSHVSSHVIPHLRLTLSHVIPSTHNFTRVILTMSVHCLITV